LYYRGRQETFSERVVVGAVKVERKVTNAFSKGKNGNFPHRRRGAGIIVW